MSQFNRGILWFVCIIIGIGSYTVYDNHQYLKSLQSGERRVECVIKDVGIVVISPERIVDVNDNVIFFDNGYATNCRVIKKGEY